MKENNYSQNHAEPIDFLFFNLAELSRSSQFVVLTALIFVFFLFYGFMQELMYELPGFELYPWYLTLVQFFLYSCFAFSELKVRNSFKRKWDSFFDISSFFSQF